MRRYCIKPRSAHDDWDHAWDVDGCDFLGGTGYERDSTPKPTGLFDAQGNELYAVDEIGPIGFVTFKTGD